MSVTDDYLSRLITNPRRGLRELIDNALDADAQRIDVVFGRSELEAIRTVTVTDDGEGMSLSRATTAFGSLGDSWKRRQTLTPGGRRRRGRRGSGRWAAFALGREVTWHSVSHPRIGRDQSTDPTSFDGVQVRGSSTELGEFDIEPMVVEDGSPGTVVQVNDVYEHAQIIDDDARRLTAHYATELRRQPDLKIVVDGEPLDPATVIADTHEVVVMVDRDDVEDASVQLVVVDWAKEVKAVRPTMVLADAAGRGLFDHLDGVARCSWNYTAYLSWDGFTTHRADLATPFAHPDSVAAVIASGLDALRDHIRGRQHAMRANLISRWKEEQSYPYTEPVAGLVEEAERDLFDLVATTAAPAIEHNDLAGRKLALRLLRETVAANPSQLMSVLREVVALTEDQLAELAELLQRTTLPAIITSAGVVTHRLDILAGLEALLHRREDAAKINEPRHLHQIVAAEPWLFGDEYTTAVSERGLAEVLRAHRRILGADRHIVDNTDPGNTAKIDAILVDGAPGRIDLMLSRVSPLTATARQHLIVELKRPGLTLGADEITQLEKYAFEIRADSRFHGQDVRWDFVLIGTKLSDFAQDKAAQLERSSSPNFRVRVLTWDHLIHQRRHQMHFVQQALEMTTDTESGVARLRVVHAAHLPEDLDGTN